MVRIELFGSMVLTLGDAPALPVTGRCARLLAYLALGRGRKVSRAELLERVWADRGDRLNAGSFNTALWRLRRLLERAPHGCGEILVNDAGNAVGLNPAVPVWLDVLEFERLTGPGLAMPSADLTRAQCDDLRAGVALYTADLLLDHSDDWVLREREKQRRTYLNALGRLMERATLRGLHAEAIAHAQAILDCEPLREDVHRALMRAYVAAGQRALALRQYETCRALLREELAIRPMPDTTALYQQIAASAVMSATPAAGEAARERRMAQLADRRAHAPVLPARPAQPASAQTTAARNTHAPATIHTPPAPADIGGCLDSARQHLQCADRQLQQGLRRLRG